jgi:predicted DNA-binding ribbon-helix-helix protein
MNKVQVALTEQEFATLEAIANKEGTTVEALLATIVKQAVNG